MDPAIIKFRARTKGRRPQFGCDHTAMHYGDTLVNVRVTLDVTSEIENDDKNSIGKQFPRCFWLQQFQRETLTAEVCVLSYICGSCRHLSCYRKYATPSNVGMLLRLKVQ